MSIEQQPVDRVGEADMAEAALFAAWHQLPLERQISVALGLVDELSDKGQKAVIQATLAIEHPLDTESLDDTFPHIVITPMWLQNELLFDDETLEHLDPLMLEVVSQSVRNHYLTDWFKEEVKEGIVAILSPKKSIVE